MRGMEGKRKDCKEDIQYQKSEEDMERVKLCHVVLVHYYPILTISYSLKSSDSGQHVLDTEVNNYVD